MRRGLASTLELVLVILCSYFTSLEVMLPRRLMRAMMQYLAFLVGHRQQQGLHRQVVPYLAARQGREPYLLLEVASPSLELPLQVQA
jgi:hypothetical protein